MNKQAVVDSSLLSNYIRHSHITDIRNFDSSIHHSQGTPLK